MGSSSKIKTLIAVALVLTLLAGILAVVLADRGAKADESKRLADFEAETEPLVMERQDLNIEYTNIERVALNSLENGSYIGIVFSEIDGELYDLFSYHFKDRLTFGAMMCLSEGAMPGGEGLITTDEFLEMCTFGWQYAVYWDGEGDLSDYLSRMRALFVDRGLEFPDTVVFRQGAYSATLDSVLTAHGVENAIHHGEENRNIVERTVDSGIWHPGILSWNTKGYSNALLVEVINHGGVAFFEVNFSGGGEICYDITNSERVEAFGRMLDTIQSCINSDEIAVTDLATARAGRERYLFCEEDMLAYVEMRRAEILARMNEIDLEISAVYSKYFG